MLICVVADASLVSGPGDTVTRSPASAAETLSLGGTQLGATSFRGPAECAEESASTPVTAASSASEVSPASSARTGGRACWWGTSP